VGKGHPHPTAQMPGPHLIPVLKNQQPYFIKNIPAPMFICSKRKRSCPLFHRYQSPIRAIYPRSRLAPSSATVYRIQGNVFGLRYWSLQYYKYYNTAFSLWPCQRHHKYDEQGNLTEKNHPHECRRLGRLKALVFSTSGLSGAPVEGNPV
jgi:hypothetical protein